METVAYTARARAGVRLCLWAFGLTLSLPLFAQSISELSLQDALASAIQRGALAAAAQGDPPYGASAWLAGLPSVSLSYLGSEERFGTDETELSVNLPLKSGPRRHADDALVALLGELDETALQQRELYYSGLLREALWAFRLADVQRRFAARKRRVLLEMEQRQRDLLAANAASEYALLLLQTELVGVELAEQDHLLETRRWLQRYSELTGLETMPADISEPALDPDQFKLQQHPRMRQLELAYSQQRQLLRANSTVAADWNLSLTAKNLDTAGYDEQQYGLGLEIPLPGIAVGRQADDSQWRAIERDYLLARDQLANELRGGWERQLNESDTLHRKLELLTRAEGLANRIADQLGRLQASNEIAQEIYLRRMMESIDTRAELAINRLLIEQNRAMLRQAAGISI